MPEDGKLKVELFGELGALLALGQNHRLIHPRVDATGARVTLVAEARNQRYLHIAYLAL